METKFNRYDEVYFFFEDWNEIRRGMVRKIIIDEVAEYYTLDIKIKKRPDYDGIVENIPMGFIEKDLNVLKETVKAYYKEEIKRLEKFIENTKNYELL